MTDQTSSAATPPTPDRPGSDAGAGTASTGPGPGGRDWVAQLQAMIENIAEQAAPVAKEVAAKAAELAAVAAEKAGPLAQKAADVTADAGVKFAERSRSLATELRRDLEGHGAGEAAGASTPVGPPPRVTRPRAGARSRPEAGPVGRAPDLHDRSGPPRRSGPNLYSAACPSDPSSSSATPGSASWASQSPPSASPSMRSWRR
jgi:hypothetical protein